MKIVVTGQVGLDKKDFLARVEQRARQEGFDLKCFHVGEMMYHEAPDVAKGRILDLPLARLESLRRSVFKDVLAAAAEPTANVLVNTHATFRWRHGLFFAFDYDQMKQLDADLYITLVDNIDTVYARLARDGHTDHSLKDLMVWREEEVMATELLSRIVAGHGKFFICTRGGDELVEMIVRLIFRPTMKKCYLSFPMSHVQALPETMAEIEHFRRQLKKYLICFDPGDMENEKPLASRALDAAATGQQRLTAGYGDLKVEINVQELLRIVPDIDGQIYVRDFKLVDQADMIISLVPELPDGMPALSSGVERELQHAHEAGKDVFVIWKPAKEPSPFITETASRVFASTDEAIRYFLEKEVIVQALNGGLFGE